MEVFIFEVLSEYGKFYILDAKSKTETDAADFWCSDANKRRLAIGEGLIGVTTLTYGKMIVSILILVKKPDKLLKDAIHIVEASIRIPSSILQVRNDTTYETQFELPIEKGTYRVRITTQKIIHSEWKEGISEEKVVDDYVIEMWKSNFAKPSVLKTFQD